MTTHSARATQFQLLHYIRKTVNFNDAGISTGVLAGTLPAGAQIVSGVVNVKTLFNAGTTNVLTVGSNSTNYNNIFAAADITEGTAAPYLLVAAGAIQLAADSDIYVKYTQTGTAATTGVATIVIAYALDNDL